MVRTKEESNAVAYTATATGHTFSDSLLVRVCLRKRGGCADGWLSFYGIECFVHIVGLERFLIRTGQFMGG